jgi:hypothetical protein
MSISIQDTLTSLTRRYERLAVRVERLERAQPEGCDDLLTRVRRLELPVQSLLGQNGELRARVKRLERLEKAQQQGQPEGPNLAEPLARTMEQRLPRVLHFYGVPLVPPIGCPDPQSWIAERIYEMGKADATCPHIRSNGDGSSYCSLAEGNSSASLTSSAPAPSTPAGQGELVRRVLNAMIDVPNNSGVVATSFEARAAIFAVILWLESQAWRGAADALRREVGR